MRDCWQSSLFQGFTDFRLFLNELQCIFTRSKGRTLIWNKSMAKVHIHDIWDYWRDCTKLISNQFRANRAFWHLSTIQYLLTTLLTNTWTSNIPSSKMRSIHDISWDEALRADIEGLVEITVRCEFMSNQGYLARLGSKCPIEQLWVVLHKLP